jgi:hypothetical protein
MGARVGQADGHQDGASSADGQSPEAGDGHLGGVDAEGRPEHLRDDQVVQ